MNAPSKAAPAPSHEPGSGAAQHKLASAQPAVAGNPGSTFDGRRGEAMDVGTRSLMGARFGRDFGAVQIHADAEADRAARSLGARAFTIGEHIAFRAREYTPDTDRGRRLLAHELTHVVQQAHGAVGPHLAPVYGGPGDAFEAQAEHVADLVARGQPVKDAVDLSVLDHASTPQIQLQADAGVTDAGPSDAGAGAECVVTAAPGTVESYYQNVMCALGEKQYAGVGNFDKAFGLLNGLSMPDMLETLQKLETAHELEVLASYAGGSYPYGMARIQAAIQTVRYAGQREIPVADAVKLATGVHSLPGDQKSQVLDWVLKHQSVVVALEDIVAILEAIPTTGTESVTTAGPTMSVQPQMSIASTPTSGRRLSPRAGPRASLRKGGGGRGQPPQLALGNLAHRMIARYYTQAHFGEIVFTNYFGLKRIVRDLGELRKIDYDLTRLGDMATKKPDIMNLSLLHLYEIKPAGLEGLALAEAMQYISALRKVGILVMPGPTNDSGANGMMALGPIGFLAFWSRIPGTIVYQLRLRALDQAANAQAMSPAQTVGTVILIVGLVAAAVLIAIAFPPAIAVEAPLLEGATAAAAGGVALEAGLGGVEVAAEVGAAADLAAAETAAGIEVTAETAAEYGIDLAGEAANDNAELVDYLATGS